MNRPLVMLAIMLAGMVLGVGIGGLVFTIASPHPTPRYVGLTIQSPANSIVTPNATKNVAINFPQTIQPNQYSALANAEASIDRSRRLTPVILGLAAVWAAIRLRRRWKN